MRKRAEEVYFSRVAEREQKDWFDAVDRVTEDYDSVPNFADLIRSRARERWLCRMRHNIAGSAEEDWVAAADRDLGLWPPDVAVVAYQRYSSRLGYSLNPERDWLLAQESLLKEDNLPPFFP